MRLYGRLFIVAALFALPACEQKSNHNQKDGVKDALDNRPNEGLRDAGEDMGDAVKDAGKGIKDAVKEK